MPYELLGKPLTVGGNTYYPGNIIPDGILFPERAEKLKRIGRISEIGGKEYKIGSPTKEGAAALYTPEEVDKIVADAISKATEEMEARQEESKKVISEMEQEKAGLQQTVVEMEREREELRQAAAEIQVPGFSSFDGIIQIPVKGESDGENGQVTVIPASPEELQEFFSIVQLNAEEGAKAIAEVKSENVLILLHAADSRKTIKNAAKEQAGKLFQTQGDLKASTGGNEPAGTDTKGDDT
ncbi:hypothetical protein [Roseburia sp. 1XD42-69]|uniref:hypothetical protein n=1 Tax=Roseburia sp. 1XD42-69 TaxID=2320088 RepID=UPI0011C40B18|nr:hypothetical protein [Roseburia sp. 1XD42-69]